MKESEQDIQPWYKQFWAWFILSPLIVVVIVSSITVTIAVKGADDRVIDNYYKEGRMINMRLDEDLLAKSMGITATLVFDDEIDELSLRLQQNTPVFPELLQLELSHPIQAELDYVVKLRRVASNQYAAELPPQPLRNRWYLRLLPTAEDQKAKGNDGSSDEIDRRWRLRGEINFDHTQTITLQADG